ncbi:MAG: hydroxyisourate hydrolase [Synechococcus sp.]
MDGKLTTHVLDTANGCPAGGLAIDLWRSSPQGSETQLVRIVTNQDGRTDRPILAGDRFEIGIYELRFAIGDYFRSRSPQLPDPMFLDIIPIRFGIADASSHYHVPLLCSPWSYSTYRGS